MTGIPSRTAGSVRKNHLWLPAALLVFVQLASGMRDIPSLSFFLIYLREEMDLAPVTISTVAAGAQVAGMLAALAGGAVTRRIGSKWVLATGLALSGLSSLAFQAPSFWAAALLWFFGGAGMALWTVGGGSYLTEIGARRSLGILAALYALSLTAGGAIGNPIAGVLIEHYGFTVFSWVAIAVSVAAFLAAAAGMPRLSQPPSRPAGNALSGLLDPLRQVNVRTVVGLRSLATVYYGIMVVLIPLLINELSGSNVLVAAYGTTNLVAASAAQLVTGRSADRWGARLPSMAAFSALVFSGVGLFLSAGTVWGLYSFGVMGIAAAWSLSTMMYVWVNDGVPKTDHPPAFGLLHAVWSLSMTAGSVLGGWLVTVQPGLPFLLGGLLNVASIFLVAGFYHHNSRRNAG